MKKPSYYIQFILILLGTSCFPQNSNDTVRLAQEVNSDLGTSQEGAFTNSNFAVFVADDDLTEIGLGEIAIVNTLNPRIKTFAEELIQDHEKIHSDLTELALKKAISLPPSPGFNNLKEVKRLNQKMGHNFDNHYINSMIDLHNKDIKLFETALKESTDSDIKSFAANALPVLRNHLAKAESLKEIHNRKE